MRASPSRFEEGAVLFAGRSFSTTLPKTPPTIDPAHRLFRVVLRRIRSNAPRPSPSRKSDRRLSQGVKTASGGKLPTLPVAGGCGTNHRAPSPRREQARRAAGAETPSGHRHRRSERLWGYGHLGSPWRGADWAYSGIRLKSTRPLWLAYRHGAGYRARPAVVPASPTSGRGAAPDKPPRRASVGVSRSDVIGGHGRRTHPEHPLRCALRALVATSLSFEFPECGPAQMAHGNLPALSSGAARQLGTDVIQGAISQFHLADGLAGTNLPLPGRLAVGARPRPAGRWRAPRPRFGDGSRQGRPSERWPPPHESARPLQQVRARARPIPAGLTSCWAPLASWPAVGTSRVNGIGIGEQRGTAMVLERAKRSRGHPCAT